MVGARPRQLNAAHDAGIDVSVEQLNYQPVRLSDIRRLARRLMEGRTVPGPSTRARLNIVEIAMP